MEKLVSSWFRNQPLPQNYIFPADKRPGKFVNVPPCNTVPVIDLAKAGAEGPDRSDVVEKILNASQEFGFFQVINHGVSEYLMEDTLELFKEFFDMPAEDKASLYSDDPHKSCRLCTSSFNYEDQDIHFWRDNLKHPCHPLAECMKSWPEKPTRYREVVGEYSVEVRKLAIRILKLICEGLLGGGEEEDEKAKGCFGDHELSKAEQLLSVNHYPPCPDPSLTLGLPKHSDPNLITILQQGDVYGLQVFKDGQWIGVEPLPSAFVVNIGHQVQIMSNGKLKSAEHRVVTNSNKARTTIVSFFHPCYESTVEPAKSLISECSPPLYRAFQYRDFLRYFAAKDGDTETVLEPYKLQA